MEQYSGVRWKEATEQRGLNRTPDPPLVGELRGKKYKNIRRQASDKMKKLKFKRNVITVNASSAVNNTVQSHRAAFRMKL